MTAKLVTHSNAQQHTWHKTFPFKKGSADAERTSIFGGCTYLMRSPWFHTKYDKSWSGDWTQNLRTARYTWNTFMLRLIQVRSFVVQYLGYNRHLITGTVFVPCNMCSSSNYRNSSWAGGDALSHGRRWRYAVQFKSATILARFHTHLMVAFDTFRTIRTFKISR